MFKFGKLVDAIGRKAHMDHGLFGRPAFLGAAFAAAALTTSGCGVTVQRDLSTAKASEVVFDDMCGLQDYFDGLKDTTLTPPAEAFAQDMTNDKGTAGGRTRFVFASEFQLHHLKKVLTENWKRLPEGVPDAKQIEVEVRWSEKAGLKRVVTNEEAILQVGEKQVFLPYHVCLSDLLFGESLYDTRRAFLGLPAAAPSPFAKPVEPAEPGAGPSRPRVTASPLPLPPSRAIGAAATAPGSSDGLDEGEEGAEVPVRPVAPTPMVEPGPASAAPAGPPASSGPAPAVPAAGR
jgi:hypothetical protein